jgi:hypothetical protein
LIDYCLADAFTSGYTFKTALDDTKYFLTNKTVYAIPIIGFCQLIEMRIREEFYGAEANKVEVPLTKILGTSPAANLVIGIVVLLTPIVHSMVRCDYGRSKFNERHSYLHSPVTNITLRRRL